MQETGIQLLDLEDPLEEEMATHSSIVAWEIPRMEEPGPWGCREVKHNSATKQQQRMQWTTLGLMNSVSINVFKQRLDLQLEVEPGIR